MVPQHLDASHMHTLAVQHRLLKAKHELAAALGNTGPLTSPCPVTAAATISATQLRCLLQLLL